MNFNKIMVAVDGSDSALHALDYAVNLAKASKAQIEVIYIVPKAIGNIDGGILPSEVEQKEFENAKMLLNGIKSDYSEVNITNVVGVGKPVVEIQKLISDWQADVFIIGHHTHSIIDKVLSGSVESSLLNHLTIPLLVIPPNYSKYAN